MIQIRISDPRSLRSWRIKGTEESILGKDFSVPLMRHDLSDLGSLILIWIIPKKRTLYILFYSSSFFSSRFYFGIILFCRALSNEYCYTPWRLVGK